MKPYYETELGKLYCGDSQKLIKELESASVRLIFTDPPYGHNNNNGDLISKRESALGKGKSEEKDLRPIVNDGPEANDLLKKLLPEFRRVLTNDGCCCCCCCGGGPDPQFARWSLMIDAVLRFKMMVVWDKGPIGMGWHYRRSYETILVATKADKCIWNDETQQIENIIRPGYRGIKKIIPSAIEHPTPKPPQLAQHFIRLHTNADDIVFDPFMGGGSTAIACEKEQRRWIGFEIDERWCRLTSHKLDMELSQATLPLTAHGGLNAHVWRS